MPAFFVGRAYPYLVNAYKISGMAMVAKNSYQIQQAKIAMPPGEFIEKDPEKVTQRNFLPQSYSDLLLLLY